MALSQWRDVVLYGMEDAAQLPYNISKLINEERDGLIVDSFTIKKAIDSLIALGFDSHNLERQNLDLYRKTFLASFLQETCNYYVAESLQYLSENSVVDYVDKVTLRLSQEDGRARTYLHPSSHKEHLAACRHALVATQLATLQSEFGRLLDVEDASHLRKMYNLLMAIPDALEPLQKQFYSFIRARGEAGLVVLYSDGQALNPTAYVLLIVGLHEHFKNLVQTCFHNDTKFLEAMGKVSFLCCAHRSHRFS